jgi:hypothetical protein
VDSTLPYSVAKTNAPQRVRRVMVLVGEEAAVTLDDILPSEGAPGQVMSYFQTAQKTTWDPASQSAMIDGLASRMRATFEGPAVTGKIRGPNDLKTSWVFAKFAQAGFFSWHTVEIDYKADPAQPLLGIFQAMDKVSDLPAARVVRPAGKIEVTLPSDKRLVFVSGPDGWTLQKP